MFNKPYIVDEEKLMHEAGVMYDNAYSVTGATVRGVILKQMDEFLRQHCNDECVFERWLLCGVPDGATTSECIEIAEDDDEYFVIVKLFWNILNSEEFDWC